MLISTPARLDLLQFLIFFSLYRVKFVFMCSHIQIYFKYENVSNKRLKIIIFVKHTFFIRTSKNFDEGQCSYFWMISVTIFSYFFIIFYETFLTHSRQKLRWNIWLVFIIQCCFVSSLFLWKCNQIEMNLLEGLERIVFGLSQQNLSSYTITFSIKIKRCFCFHQIQREEKTASNINLCQLLLFKVIYKITVNVLIWLVQVQSQWVLSSLKQGTEYYVH